MRELTYFIATTLDGRIAAPDGSADFFPVDPGYLTELAADWGDAFPTAFHRAVGSEPPRTRFDTVVMGRGTFEPALAAGVLDPYEHLETHVFSATLDPATLPDVRVVPGDPVAHVRALKAAAGGGIWLCGGGRLAASLVDEIDRVAIKLNPLTVGAGRPWLDGVFDLRPWRLGATRTYAGGVVLLEYVRADAPDPGPAGRVARGTFDVELRPAGAEIGGAAGRFDFDKTFHGDLDAVGAGLMLTAGDPQRGAAGYVAIESVTGRLDGRRGSLLLQQLGHLADGSHTLTYQVVPGSGTDDLAGVTGTLDLTVDDDGTHRYALTYAG